MSLEAKKHQLERILAERKRVKLDVPDDPVEFCSHLLGFDPTNYQRKFLRDNSQFVALRWCRQSGKSFTVAAYILHHALKNPGSHIAVVAPSFRQSKLIIRRVSSHLLRLPKWILIGGKPLRTRVAFKNGSLIEAFPNNPDTIRGPTLDLIYCDEMNFIKDDEEMYDAILFTLGTTNGRFIAASTPWSTDHVFYRICVDPDYDDYSRHHVTWRMALEPNGPLKKVILEKIQRQLAADPWRWKREMEAEWAEDEDVWLSQKLITSCIDPNLEYYDERDLIANV